MKSAFYVRAAPGLDIYAEDRDRCGSRTHRTLRARPGLRGVLLLAALVLGACDAGPEVEVISPTRGEIRESFTEPARTRLAHTYPITMPLDGRIGRIELVPGDPVEAGQVLVPVDRRPFEEAVREARAAVAELEQQIVLNEYDAIERSAKVELEATVEAARQALAAADAQVEAEQARAERAVKEYQRIESLAEKGNVSRQELDDAALAAETALIELRQQELLRAALDTLFTAIKLGPEYIEEWLGRKRLQREVIAQQLVQARARLARAEHELSLAEIRAPVDGVVLERYEQGGGPLPAGQPLLLIGNPAELEAIADVLTEDALRLRVGTPVVLGAATLPMPVEGRVERVEPAAFTKLSSLGVEQQRVNVIIGLDQVPTGLGVGYRLQARFITGIEDEALVVPRFSVLQDADGAFYVLEVVDGRLVRQPVTLGLRSDLRLEVREGLMEEDVIVAAPDAAMAGGQRVRIVRP